MPKVLLLVASIFLGTVVIGCASEEDYFKQRTEEMQRYMEEIGEYIEKELESEPIKITIDDPGSWGSVCAQTVCVHAVSPRVKRILEITNEGSQVYDFRIPALNLHLRGIYPGETVRIEITTPKKAGRYEIISSDRVIAELVVLPSIEDD